MCGARIVLSPDEPVRRELPPCWPAPTCSRRLPCDDDDDDDCMLGGAFAIDGPPAVLGAGLVVPLRAAVVDGAGTRRAAFEGSAPGSWPNTYRGCGRVKLSVGTNVDPVSAVSSEKMVSVSGFSGG